MQFKRLLLCALIPFLISCAREPKESNFLPDLITHDIVSKQMKKCKTISCVETAYGDALEDRADPKTGLLMIISLKAQDHLECITVAIPLKSTNLWGLCMR